MQVCDVISFLLLPQLVGLEVAFLWAALKVVCVCVCMGIKSVQITAHTHTDRHKELPGGAGRGLGTGADNLNRRQPRRSHC